MPTKLNELKLHSSGKVREIYEDGDELIMVASDRISAFDVVLPEPIPEKGKVLTQMSIFWFETTGSIVPNHLIDERVPEEVAGRALRVKRLDMYPVECVVRGYLSGSGWKEYRQSQSVCGIQLPGGLQESDQLPEPIFTPATKAEIGEHDENIDFDRACEIVGSRPLMEELRRVSIELYEHARAHAYERGIILADTKFELGSSPGRGGRSRRRGPDPRLLPLLARRRLRARARAGLLRQAVRPRLPRRAGLGSLASGARPAAGGDRRNHGQVPRGIRADHRPAAGLAREAPPGEAYEDAHSGRYHSDTIGRWR